MPKGVGEGAEVRKIFEKFSSSKVGEVERHICHVRETSFETSRNFLIKVGEREVDAKNVRVFSEIFIDS